MMQNNSDPEFGRTAYSGTVEDGTFVNGKMQMHYHLTFGGLVVDENMRVRERVKENLIH